MSGGACILDNLHCCYKEEEEQGQSTRPVEISTDLVLLLSLSVPILFHCLPSTCFDQCRISISGASEYKINGKVVNAKEYNDALSDHNILVKAKNFLVFQGDVEAVASQSPKDLTRLIEQISG